MIDLHYRPTPNGHRITLMREELVDAGHPLEYAIKPVDIGAGDQFKPEYLAISPNNITANVKNEGTGSRHTPG